jgi:hypothetical protein
MRGGGEHGVDGVAADRIFENRSMIAIIASDIC